VCSMGISELTMLLPNRLVSVQDWSMSRDEGRHPTAMFLLQLGIILPTLAVLVILILREPSVIKPELLVWATLIAGVELLPVSAWRGLQVSLSAPLLMMVGVLYPPAAAAPTALLGLADPREFKHQIGFLKALFNRCQVALSVLAASSVYHAMAGSYPRGDNESAYIGILGSLAAAVAGYVINSGSVAIYVTLDTGLRAWEVIKELRIGRLSTFLVNYLGLSVLGLALAVLYTRVGLWVLPAVVAPLIFARQMFFRSQALEVAHRELQDREQLLRSLSNAMAEERADERQKIAAYLHDDLAQVLFRLSIQVDVAKKLLEKGDIDDIADQLERIRESKQDTSDRIRALIRDLHRSPLGAKGLADALESFTDEVGSGSSIRFHHDVEDVPMPAPLALLVYHIAREGLMNALKHAQASEIWVTVRGDGEVLELQLRDDGIGFDVSAPGPEGHFGMGMMRERAQIGGGTLEVESAPGEGTTITVRFPISLLRPEPSSVPSGTGPEAGSPAAHGSPGTSGIAERADEGSRGSVRV